MDNNLLDLKNIPWKISKSHRPLVPDNILIMCDRDTYYDPSYKVLLIHYSRDRSRIAVTLYSTYLNTRNTSLLKYPFKGMYNLEIIR